MFNIFNSPEKVLSKACSLVDQSLVSRGPRAVEMLTKSFESVLNDEETLQEFTPSELYTSSEDQIAKMRDRLVQLALADMGQLQTTVVELGLDRDVHRFANASAAKFTMAAKEAIDKIATRYGCKPR